MGMLLKRMFIIWNRLIKTAEQLKSESQIPLNKYQLADNIALVDIIHVWNYF